MSKISEEIKKLQEEIKALQTNPMLAAQGEYKKKILQLIKLRRQQIREGKKNK